MPVNDVLELAPGILVADNRRSDAPTTTTTHAPPVARSSRRRGPVAGVCATSLDATFLDAFLPDLVQCDVPGTHGLRQFAASEWQLAAESAAAASSVGIQDDHPESGRRVLPFGLRPIGPRGMCGRATTPTNA